MCLVFVFCKQAVACSVAVAVVVPVLCLISYILHSHLFVSLLDVLFCVGTAGAGVEVVVVVVVVVGVVA